MRLLVGLTALLASTPPLGAQLSTPGERLPVVKYVLPNGMTFLFLRREGAPTVAFVTHFRAGGVDEWTGISGTAHLFEHMLFKGTRAIGTKNYAAEQAMFPRVDAVADVVMEERRLRVETSPGGLLREEFLAAAYRAHPYGRPVVGVASEIQTVSRTAAQEYFRRFYGPNNAVVSIVGDINVDSMKAWATRYFADIPAGQPHRPVVTQEPPQHGERRIEVEYDANPQVLIGYHVPEARHPDAPALAVLSQLLTGGRTSHLFQRLAIKERAATNIFSGSGPGAPYPRLFTFTVVPIAPHTTAELEGEIYEELDRLKREPPSPQ